MTEANLGTRTETPSERYTAKGRYDRFLTTNNALYASANVLRDQPAGLDLRGGGQIGYSRQLLNDKKHLLVVETGYDLAFERASAEDAKMRQIHSARFFVGETFTLSKATGITASFEALTNINEVGEAVTGGETIDPLKDVRLNSKLTLTTTLFSNVSFAFAIQHRYDARPAPLGSIDGFATSGVLAKNNDVLVDASLIWTLF